MCSALTKTNRAAGTRESYQLFLATVHVRPVSGCPNSALHCAASAQAKQPAGTQISGMLQQILKAVAQILATAAQAFHGQAVAAADGMPGFLAAAGGHKQGNA
jgi:hypothetical protein